MPIFEYRCEECGNEFELIVFGGDTPECPSCGDKNPVKKMSTFGFSVGYKYKSSAGSGSGCAGCSSSNCSSCSS